MKKVLFVAIVLAVVSKNVNAQTGSILVGGSIDFSSAKTAGITSDTKTTNFAFSPTVGYQFNENWTAGLVADIGSSKTTVPNVTSTTTVFDIGPFIRYAKSISNTFAVYGQLQGAFGTQKENSVRSSLADIKAFPALFINFGHSFGLNFSVGGIEYNSSKPSGSSASNEFSFTFGRAVGIGISKNFGGGKKK
ncbi:MAG: hypothetical protein QM726_17215 [Chitinophagaceae bacterium]